MLNQHTITSYTYLRYVSDLIINAVIVDPGFNITLNIDCRTDIREKNKYNNIHGEKDKYRCIREEKRIF